MRNKKTFYLLAVIGLTVLSAASCNYNPQKLAGQKEETNNVKDEKQKIAENELKTEDEKKIQDKETGEEEKNVKIFNITGKKFSFSPAEIKVKKDDKIIVNFENIEGFHSWGIDEFNVRTKNLNVGEKDTVEFTADKIGTFEYYCSVDGHRDFGMVGKLIVE